MLKVIATFLLIYLLFRLVTMWVLPRIGRWYVERYKKRFVRENPWAAEASRRQREEAHQRQEAQSAGIHHPGPSGGPGRRARKPGAGSDRLGEYVDFEEIDD